MTPSVEIEPFHLVEVVPAGEACAFDVTIEHDGTMVGDCVLMLPSAEHHQGEIGFTVHPDHQGRGYATEAARAVRDYALGPLGLCEVLALVRPANAPSIHVLEKIGMEPAGTRRAYGAEHLVYVARAAT